MKKAILMSLVCTAVVLLVYVAFSAQAAGQ
jgi:hypothetical protein